MKPNEIAEFAKILEIQNRDFMKMMSQMGQQNKSQEPNEPQKLYKSLKSRLNNMKSLRTKRVPGNKISGGVDIIDKVFPIREGSKTAFAAIAGSGKTSTLQTWIKGVDTNKYEIVYLMVGERDYEEDSWSAIPGVTTFAIDSSTAMDEGEIEDAINEIDDCIDYIESSSKSVIFVIDSLTRVIDWLSSVLVDRDSPTLTGGLRVESMDLAKKMLSIAGEYGNRTITIIGTLLDASDKGKQSVIEMMDSVTDGILPLTKPNNGWSNKSISIDWKSTAFTYRGDANLYYKIKETFKANTNDEINEIISSAKFDLNQF